MKSSTRDLKQPPITYQGAGGVSPSKISLAYGIRYLELRYTGQITVAGASNTAAATKRGDELAAIAKIELLQDGSDVVMSITGDQLWHINLFYSKGRLPQVTSAIGDGATANPSWDTTLILPIHPERVVSPIDFTLDARKRQELKLQVTFNDGTSINAAAAAAYAVNPNIEIVGVFDLLDDLDPSKSNFDLHRFTTRSLAFTAADTNARFELPLGQGLNHLGFLINTAVAGVDTAACFTNVQLKSGSTIFKDYSEKMLRESYKSRLGIVGAGGAGAVRRSVQSNLDAWTYMWLPTDGYKTEAIDVTAATELILEFNLVTPCTVTVIADHFIRGRG